jgi:hypothetical protein
MAQRYDQLKEQIEELQKANKLPESVTREEKISWAYGNAVIENDEVTRTMAQQAVDKLTKK